MRIIILAAGYATRLYPLTEHQPKPLLEVGGHSIIDRLLQQVRPLTREIVVVCNAKFQSVFEAWCPADVTLISNVSQTPEDRLGAVGDLDLVLQRVGLDEPVLVVAADNLFEPVFSDMLSHALRQQTSAVAVWHNEDPQDCKQRGNVQFDNDSRVRRFVEKPERPDSSWSAAPLYWLLAADLPLVRTYLDGGHNADAPGHLLEWLCQQTAVSAFCLDHRPVDIGTVAALEAARARFDAHGDVGP